MALAYRRISVRTDPFFDLGGSGYLAGKAPDNSDPNSLDGRLRMLNVPSAGRVVALERTTLRIAGTALSQPDGTWRIDGLSRHRQYLVLGFDEYGRYNAAVQDWVTPAVS